MRQSSSAIPRDVAPPRHRRQVRPKSELAAYLEMQQREQGGLGLTGFLSACCKALPAFYELRATRIDRKELREWVARSCWLVRGTVVTVARRPDPRWWRHVPPGGQLPNYQTCQHCGNVTLSYIFKVDVYLKSNIISCSLCRLYL